MPVTTITPTSLLSKPLGLCADLLAASVRWQEHLDDVHGDVDNADDALNHIFYPYVHDATNPDGTLVYPRSRGIVNPSIHYNLKNIGSATWYDHGDVIMAFEVRPPQEGDALANVEDEMLWFLELVGDVLKDMRYLAGTNLIDRTSTYLNVYEFVLIDGPSECVQADENGEHFYGAAFQVCWKG
jgi:hypothetical protein